ncbi:hypothetical protein B0H11DRAFT_1928492 [Mycena galericulata]|nr:hypothetical protein B0H11DRAFT_1928492 [Mycena galericulata]
MGEVAEAARAGAGAKEEDAKHHYAATTGQRGERKSERQRGERRDGGVKWRKAGEVSWAWRAETLEDVGCDADVALETTGNSEGGQDGRIMLRGLLLVEQVEAQPQSWDRLSNISRWSSSCPETDQIGYEDKCLKF